MILGYDYPILGLFWTMIMLFLWIAWIMLLFRVFIDIFRSRDMGGLSKGLWAIFVLVVPFLGVFVYLIARGHSMAERDLKEVQQNDAAFRAYVQDAAGSAGGTAAELEKLADLNARGVISDEEFQVQKARILA